MKTIIVDDDPDLRLLIRATLASDPRFEIVGEAVAATDAVELALQEQPDLIILDYLIEGEFTGLEAVPLLRVAAPNAKFILFTGFENLGPASDSVAVLVKTKIEDLVPLAQQLLGLEPIPK